MELSSAERYNPHTNSWSPIVAMTSRRSGVGLAVVNGALYAVRFSKIFFKLLIYNFPNYILRSVVLMEQHT